jgi:hypothetical protein
VTPQHGLTPEQGEDRRSWMVLVAVIAVCFLLGIAFLVFSVWLDWS